MPDIAPDPKIGADTDLSRLQRFFRRWMSPETFAAHMAQSKKWVVTCPHCAFRQTIWDMGGLRGGKTGKPATYVRCKSCNRRGWHPVRFAP